nr:MAG TPA: hypothetical protein [Caudoviricetes sp.]
MNFQKDIYFINRVNYSLTLLETIREVGIYLNQKIL